MNNMSMSMSMSNPSPYMSMSMSMGMGMCSTHNQNVSLTPNHHQMDMSSYLDHHGTGAGAPRFNHDTQQLKRKQEINERK